MQLDRIKKLCNDLSNELSVLDAYAINLENKQKSIDSQSATLAELQHKLEQKGSQVTMDIKRFTDMKSDIEEIQKNIGVKTAIIEKQDNAFKARMQELDKREQIIKTRESQLITADAILKEREDQVNKVKLILEKEQEGQREMKARLDIEDKKLQARAKQLSNILK